MINLISGTFKNNIFAVDELSKRIDLSVFIRNEDFEKRS